MSAAEESSQIRSGLTDQLPDKDPQETSEWIESLDGLIEERGTERAQYIMRSLMQRASAQSVALPYVTTTDYVNTIPADQEPEYPGDEELERRYRNYLRWNAMALVQRAHGRDHGNACALTAPAGDGGAQFGQGADDRDAHSARALGAGASPKACSGAGKRRSRTSAA